MTKLNEAFTRLDLLMKVIIIFYGKEKIIWDTSQISLDMGHTGQFHSTYVKVKKCALMFVFSLKHIPLMFARSPFFPRITNSYVSLFVCIDIYRSSK